MSVTPIAGASPAAYAAGDQRTLAPAGATVVSTAVGVYVVAAAQLSVLVLLLATLITVEFAGARRPEPAS